MVKAIKLQAPTHGAGNTTSTLSVAISVARLKIAACNIEEVELGSTSPILHAEIVEIDTKCHFPRCLQYCSV